MFAGTVAERERRSPRSIFSKENRNLIVELELLKKGPGAIRHFDPRKGPNVLAEVYGEKHVKS